MYCDDWKPSLAPQLLRKIRERKRAEAAKAKRKEAAEAKKKAIQKREEAPKIIEIEAPTSEMPVRKIISLVAARHGMNYNEIILLRDRKHVKARYDAIETVHRLKPGLSSSQIGRFFNRDHTTILYALGRVKGGKGKKS